MNENKPSSILFVCMGNTCRSPMAEYIAREMFNEKNLDIKVASRGTSATAYTGFKIGASRDSCMAVREIYPKNNIFIHVPEALRVKDIFDYEIVLTMTESQRDSAIKELREYMPEIEKKVFSLKEYAGFEAKDLEERLDIEDPMGGGISYGNFSQVIPYSPNKKEEPKANKYTTARDEIIQCLEKVLDNGFPPAEQLIEKRNRIEEEREKLKIKKEKERQEAEISKYQNVLELFYQAEQGSEVQVESPINSDITSSNKKIDDYLQDIVSEMKRVVEERKLTITFKPFTAAKSTLGNDYGAGNTKAPIALGGALGGGQTGIPPIEDNDFGD